MWEQDLDARTDPHLQPVELSRCPPFDLGDIHVVPLERRMDGPAGSVILEPRIMQILVALADGHGEVIPREQLVARCWPGMVVGEDSLNRAIAGLRRALRDAGSTDVKLQTLPKVGYRIGTTGDGQAADKRGPLEQPARVSRRWLLGGGAVFAAGAVAAWALRGRSAPKADSLADEAEALLIDGRFGTASKARGLLEQVIADEPGHARAWGLLAMSWRAIAANSPPETVESALESARTAGATALELERAQGDAHVALAQLTPLFGHWLPTQLNLTQAADVAPDNIHGLAALAFLYASVGRMNAAADVSRQLLKIHPGHPVAIEMLVMSLWAEKEVDAALAVAGPDFETGNFIHRQPFTLAWMLALNGRAEEADRLIARSQAEQTEPSRILIAMRSGLAAVLSGQSADIDAAEEAFRSIARISGLIAATSAMGLAALGRTDAAFELVEALYQGALQPNLPDGETLARQFRTPTRMLFLPPFEPVRADPRFLPLCETIGLARFWRESGAKPDFLSGQLMPL